MDRSDLGNILSKTWKIYSANFGVILFVTLVVYIPVNLILSLISNIDIDFLGFISFERIARTLVLLIELIATLAIIFIAAKAFEGGTLRFKEAIALSAGKWGRGIITGLLEDVIIIALLILLVVPGLVWAVYYSFTYQAVALRDLKNKEALDYSKFLVKGNFWRILGYSLVIGLISAIPAFALFHIKIIVISFFGLEPFKIVLSTINNVLGAFSIVGMTVLFLETEQNKEDYTPEPSAYEKLNSFINKDSRIDESGDIDEQDDEDAVWCSVCGIKVTRDTVICPMCHSVIRHDE